MEVGSPLVMLSHWHVISLSGRNKKQHIFQTLVVWDKLDAHMIRHGALLKHGFCSAGLQQGRKGCTSNKLPSDAAGPWVMHWVAKQQGTYRQGASICKGRSHQLGLLLWGLDGQQYRWSFLEKGLSHPVCPSTRHHRSPLKQKTVQKQKNPSNSVCSGPTLCI